MRTSIFLILAIFALFIVSCNNGEMEKLVAERDSLQTAYSNSEKDLKELNSLVSDIASSLDSISLTEKALYTDKDKDGVLLDKKQILENLETFGEILARQKRRIAQLEDSLQTVDSSKWNIIISSIRMSLEEKEQEVLSLKEELATKNKDIRNLRNKLATTESEVNSVKEQNTMLQNAIAAQDEVINECYVRIGTKKELQEAGLLKGGFLAKKKVNYEKLDKSTFAPVDIRKFRIIELNSKDPKILTPVPAANTYHFETENNKKVLYIDNPTEFWSVSNYLIIQL